MNRPLGPNLGTPEVEELQIIQVGDPLPSLQQADLGSATTGNGQWAILADDLPQLSLYVRPDRLREHQGVQRWADTPGCPPCGVSLNTHMLVTGSTDPVPG